MWQLAALGRIPGTGTDTLPPLWAVFGGVGICPAALRLLRYTRSPPARLSPCRGRRISVSGYSLRHLPGLHKNGLDAGPALGSATAGYGIGYDAPGSCCL